MCRVKGKDYYIHVAPPEVLYRAQELYFETLQNTRFNNWLNADQVKRLLVQQGFISPEHDQNLVKIEERMDELKVSMYESVFNSKARKEMKATLDKVRTKYFEMLGNATLFSHITLEGYADAVRTFYIYSNTIHDSDGNMLKCPPELVDVLIQRSLRNKISVSEFREVSRSEPWRSFWNSKKETMFHNIYGADQRTIILYSKMYDNCFQHPECPPDDVIEDDDIFDGWMISLRRKREQEQMTNQIENQLGGRHSNASDVFIGGVGNQEEANKIYRHNDLEGRMIQRERAKFIEKHGKVKESQLPDVKRDNMQMAHQKFRETVKKGKK